MLDSKRDAYDRDATEHSESYMEHRDLYSSAQDPDDIHQNGQTASVIGIRLNVVSKRPQCKTCHLEKLESERNTDDADAVKQPCDCVIKADYKSSQEQPKYVTQKLHGAKIAIFRKSRRDLARDRVQFYSKIARGPPFFRGTASNFPMFLHSVQLLQLCLRAMPGI